KYTVGKGEVIWWASSTPITNAGITQPGNLEFFLACLADPARPILRDEYFHGHRGAAPLRVATRSALRFLTVPVGLVVLAALLPATTPFRRLPGTRTPKWTTPSSCRSRSTAPA